MSLYLKLSRPEVEQVREELNWIHEWIKERHPEFDFGQIKRAMYDYLDLI